MPQPSVPNPVMARVLPGDGVNTSRYSSTGVAPFPVNQRRSRYQFMIKELELASISYIVLTQTPEADVAALEAALISACQPSCNRMAKTFGVKPGTPLDANLAVTTPQVRA